VLTTQNFSLDLQAQEYLRIQHPCFLYQGYEGSIWLEVSKEELEQHFISKLLVKGNDLVAPL
jgi:hypothetical protein